MSTELSAVIVVSFLIGYLMMRKVVDAYKNGHCKYRKSLEQVLEVLERNVDDPDYAAIDICRKALGKEPLT